MPKFTRLKPKDNVLLALEAIGLGADLGGVLSAQRVPSGHKIAASDIDKGSPVIKYGHIIGHASTDIAQGSLVHEHNLYVPQALQQPSASALTLALQCGGSDAYSGITANPALGVAADLLIADGGCAILAETPEIYGAEHLLMQRATSKEIADKLAERISWWEHYTARHDMMMNNNPSPGNKMGGLTTILEKSLGAVAKGGASALQDVVRYAEVVKSKGLVFMDTPGYDPVSATGQVAGGANIMCFTTGRGSAFGCKPTPCLKLASNNAMYGQMHDDMDINCGDILDGVSYEVKGREIYDHILATASGAKSKSELLGYGDNEFVPWQIGATM